MMPRNDAENLITINIREGFTELSKENLPNDFASAQKIVVPASVKVIKPRAFSCFPNLQQIEFAQNSKLKTIGKEAFSGCLRLTEIKIPESVKEIGEKAFPLDIKILKDFHLERYIDKKKKTCTIPNFPELTSLRAADFPREKFENVETIVVPDTVSTIEEGTFCGLANLKNVQFGEKSCLYRIRENVFAYTGLESINIPKNVTGIKKGVFYSCQNLKKVTFKGGAIEKIENNAFAGTGLPEIQIPASVKEIGDCAFSGCKNLKQVKFAEGSQLEKIGDKAFDGSGLEYIVIPKENLQLGENVFPGNTKVSCPTEINRFLKHIYSENGRNVCIIPEDVETKELIEANFVHDRFDFVTKIKIPDCITKINAKTFFERGQLKTVIFGEKSQLQLIDSQAFAGTGLTEIQIPAKVEKIGMGAFVNCEKLQKVTFAPDSQLETIGESAFLYNPNLQEIIIPESVVKIEAGAFKGCNQLKTVIFREKSQLQMIDSQAFAGTGLTEIKIPESAKVDADALPDGTKITRCAVKEKIENLNELSGAENSKNTTRSPSVSSSSCKSEKAEKSQFNLG